MSDRSAEHEEMARLVGTLRYIEAQAASALDGKQDAKACLKVIQMNARQAMALATRKGGEA